MKKAAFLDRDGVINVDHGYVFRREDFEWVDGAVEGMKKLSELGYELVVVTNQSGIGRGYYSEQDFLDLCEWMKISLAERGVRIARICYCPHHPSKALPEYLKDCACRKPRPGMILQAAQELSIDLSRSVMLGDKPSDVDAALAAGIPTRFILSKNGAGEPEHAENATASSRSLLEAAERLQYECGLAH